MKAYQRLLSYVKISTPSNEESSSSPSSQCQFDLARLLVEELKGLGISDESVTFMHIFLLQKVWSTAKHWALSLIWIRFPISATMQSHR